MGRKTTAKTAETKAAEEETTVSAAPEIRIICREKCSKLSKRGGGDLTYELGFNDTSGAEYVRIAGNVGSGTYSHEWVDLSKIAAVLEGGGKEEQPFMANVFRELFQKKSNNNHGYIAAILKAEGVIRGYQGQPSMLGRGSLDQIQEKIQLLQGQGANMTDHIAIAARERAEKKAQRMAQMRAVKKPKPVPKEEPELEEPEAGEEE